MMKQELFRRFQSDDEALKITKAYGWVNRPTFLNFDREKKKFMMKQINQKNWVE